MRAAAALLALLVAGCATGQGARTGGAGCGMDLRRLFADELALRPEAEPVDLYLLLREALLGPARQESEAELAAQMAALAPGAEEPLVEDLDEVRGTVRVNLRRWLYVRGTARHLHDALEASAVARADPARMAACAARAPAALAALGVDGTALEALLLAMEEEAWPVVEHSEKYQRTYRPAYRVVLRGQLPAWVTAPPPTTG